MDRHPANGDVHAEGGHATGVCAGNTLPGEQAYALGSELFTHLVTQAPYDGLYVVVPQCVKHTR